MRLTALPRIQQDHEDLLDLADRIADTLERRVTKSELEVIVHDVLDAYERTIRAHLAREKRCFLDVLREHLGDANPETIDGALEQAYLLHQAMLGLRQGVETGARMRPLLEEAEITVREHVEYEETHILPWGVRALGPVLLQEVERRHRAMPDGQVIGIDAPVVRAHHPPMI